MEAAILYQDITLPGPIQRRHKVLLGEGPRGQRRSNDRQRPHQASSKSLVRIRAVVLDLAHHRVEREQARKACG
jgi:hypothetical protein